jgi:hypothetical protein
MADWEDIVLGGAVGTIGGFFLSKRKGDTPIPPMVEDALIRHKAKVEAKISSQQSQKDPETIVVGVSGKEAVI